MINSKRINLTNTRIICGFPTVGKTTALIALRKSGYEVWDTDALNQEFKESKFPSLFIEWGTDHLFKQNPKSNVALRDYAMAKSRVAGLLAHAWLKLNAKNIVFTNLKDIDFLTYAVPETKKLPVYVGYHPKDISLVMERLKKRGSEWDQSMIKDWLEASLNVPAQQVVHLERDEYLSDCLNIPVSDRDLQLFKSYFRDGTEGYDTHKKLLSLFGYKF